MCDAAQRSSTPVSIARNGIVQLTAGPRRPTEPLSSDDTPFLFWMGMPIYDRQYVEEEVVQSILTDACAEVEYLDDGSVFRPELGGVLAKKLLGVYIGIDHNIPWTVDEFDEPTVVAVALQVRKGIDLGQPEIELLIDNLLDRCRNAKRIAESFGYAYSPNDE